MLDNHSSAPDIVCDYVSRARYLFNEGYLMTKSECSEECFTLKSGQMSASWSDSDYYNNGITCISGVEIPIEPSYVYRFVLPDSSVVECREEFLYVNDDASGCGDGVFLMYYVPSPDYVASHPYDIENILDNGGDMKDFSGLKIYTTLDGYPVRINRYFEGRCAKGLFLPDLKTEEDILDGFKDFLSLLGGMTIQRYRVETATKVSLAVNEKEDDLWLEAAICIGYDDSSSSSGFGLYDSILRALERSRGTGGGGYAGTIGNGGSTGKSASGTSLDPDDAGKDLNINRKEEFKRDSVIVDINVVKNKLISKIVIGEGVSESSSKYLADLIETTLQNHSDLSLVADVWDGIKDRITEIQIKGNGVPNAATTKVSLPHDQVDNIVSVCEEFFHIYQRKTDSWPAGNLELEAKIYDCLLIDCVNNNEAARNIFDAENYKAFMAFYNNPNDDTFRGVVRVLRSLPGRCYNEDKFPIDGPGSGQFDSYSDLLKHIRGLRRAEN